MSENNSSKEMELLRLSLNDSFNQVSFKSSESNNKLSM